MRSFNDLPHGNLSPTRNRPNDPMSFEKKNTDKEENALGSHQHIPQSTTMFRLPVSTSLNLSILYILFYYFKCFPSKILMNSNA